MTEEEMGGKKLDHVAIAVEDLSEAVDIWSRILGSPPDQMETNREFGVRVAIYRLGEVKIELMEGLDPDTTIAKFVEKQGPGLHHLCFSVSDLKETIAGLSLDGFEIIGGGDDIGVEGYPVAFTHPKSTGGVLTEFIEETGTGLNDEKNRS
ncbi:methylmalonyl-CoA epimerase [Candidatus Zixiibacteriota bacterium]